MYSLLTFKMRTIYNNTYPRLIVETDLPYFSDYKMHFFPQIWEENGGASYSLNVAYLTHEGGGAAVE